MCFHVYYNEELVGKHIMLGDGGNLVIIVNLGLKWISLGVRLPKKVQSTPSTFI